MIQHRIGVGLSLETMDARQRNAVACHLLRTYFQEFIIDDLPYLPVNQGDDKTKWVDDEFDEEDEGDISFSPEYKILLSEANVLSMSNAQVEEALGKIRQRQ